MAFDKRLLLFPLLFLSAFGAYKSNENLGAQLIYHEDFGAF